MSIDTCASAARPAGCRRTIRSTRRLQEEHLTRAARANGDLEQHIEAHVKPCQEIDAHSPLKEENLNHVD